MKMPTSIPTRPCVAETGFTLVEMLLVVFILGLASAAVVLMLPASGGAVRSDAERLAARVAAARDHAVLEAEPIAVWTRPSGYGFERRTNGAWRAHTDPAFRDRTLDRGVRIADSAAKHISFDATGMPSQATDIALVSDNGRAVVRISASGEVAIVN